MSLSDEKFTAQQVCILEARRLKTLSNVKCKGCNKLMTNGELESAGICSNCYFKELEEQNENNLKGDY